jgi:hypothetical protein
MNLLFIITQNISVSYIFISYILDVFSIRHFKITERTFDKAKIIRKLRRLLAIRTKNFHIIITVNLTIKR